MPKITPTQQAVLDRINKRGFLNGGDGYPDVRLATVKRLEALGLITLEFERTYAMWLKQPKWLMHWTAKPVA